MHTLHHLVLLVHAGCLSTQESSPRHENMHTNNCEADTLNHTRYSYSMNPQSSSHPVPSSIRHVRRGPHPLPMRV